MLQDQIKKMNSFEFQFQLFNVKDELTHFRFWIQKENICHLEAVESSYEFEGSIPRLQNFV